MKTRILLATVVAMAAITVACAKKEEAPPAESAAQPPAVDEAAASAEAAANKAMEHFGDKPYKVCDRGNHDKDPPANVKGRHLDVGDEVRLSESGSQLQLTLGQQVIDVTASDDGAKLVGEAEFKHDLIAAPNAAAPAAASPVMMKHQVNAEISTNYRPPAPPNPKCKNEAGHSIIAIDFCPPDGAGGFKCNPNDEHQGDVHGEN